MPQLSFRLTEIEDAKLRELWCLYHVDGDNDTDKMGLFIEKLHKTLTFDKVSIEGLETPQELQDILIGLKCPIRIEHGKAYFCVNRPPQNDKTGDTQDMSSMQGITTEPTNWDKNRNPNAN